MHGGSGKGDRGRRKRRKKRVCGGGEGRQEMGKRRGGRTTGFLIYWSLKLLREKGGKGDSEEGGRGRIRLIGFRFCFCSVFRGTAEKHK